MGVAVVGTGKKLEKPSRLGGVGGCFAGNRGVVHRGFQ